MRRIQPTRNPDHDLRVVQRPQPLFEPGNLNVVGLIAVLLQPVGVGRYKREPLDLAPQADVTHRWVEPKIDAPERLRQRPVMATVVVERSHSQPFCAKQLSVDVGHRSSLSFGKTFGFGEQRAVLPNHGLAVPGQVGRRLTLPRGGVDVGSQTTRGRRAGEQLAILGATDRDRAAGQVGQQRRSGQRGLRAGRNRHEHVLADLDVQHEARQVGRREQKVRAERRFHPGDPDGAALVVSGCDLTLLVELAVRRQVRLGHHPKHGPAVNDDRGVVDAVSVAQRRADHEHRQQAAGCGDDVEQCGFDGVEQRILQQDVFDGVPRQGQLREDGQGNPVLVALARQPQYRLSVGCRIADRSVLRACGDPDKALAVAVVEVHGPSIVARPVLIPDHRVSPPGAGVSAVSQIRTLE